MDINFNEKETKIIIDRVTYIENTFDENEVIKQKAELLDLLLMDFENEKLYTNELNTDLKLWFHQNVQSKILKRLSNARKNRKQYLKKKNKEEQ